jgi:N-acetylglucosamine kinase-like BadF-type ATPase
MAGSKVSNRWDNKIDNSDATKIYLGIDVGQTKTQFLYIHGDEVDEFTLDGLTHSDSNLLELLISRFTKFAKNKNLSNSDIVIGFTHVPTESVINELLMHLKVHFEINRISVLGDEITSYIGALGLQEGVVLGIGTGIACSSFDPMAGFKTYGGYGFLVSDEGSGYWIGKEGIAAALRAIENRGPQTSLAQALLAQYGSLSNMVHEIYESSRPSKEVAKFAKTVFDASKQDAVANQIIDSAVIELVKLISEPLSKSKSQKFSIIGGLTANTDFVSKLKKSIYGQIPTASFIDPLGNAVDGCIEIAKQGEYFQKMNSETWVNKITLHTLFQ